MFRKMMLCVAALAAASASGKTAAKEEPSRPPEKRCAWERLSDPKVGLEAWVQRCDFGFRKIDFLFAKGSLALRYSDGGDVYPVVDVYALAPGESPESGAKRIFHEKTEKDLAARCILVPYRDEFSKKPPPGAERFTFVPDKAYAAELAAKGEPEGVPDPPCGDWGESPDGIGYWEAQPARNPHRILFVQVGQDTPLFDEQTLKILPAK
jgi:hypothetical protein